MSLQILHDEIANDPLSRGYAGMTNAEIVNSLNTKNITFERTHLSSAEIYEATDIAEFQGKSDTQKVYVRDIWGLGENIPVGTGSKARTVYLTVFGAGSNTINSISSILQTTISRAEQLGLGTVTEGLVIEAKAWA